MDGKVSASKAELHSSHYPVMLAEVLAGLAIDPAGTYIDATFGAGGHSRAILDQLGSQGKLQAFDADAACAQTAEKINDPRLEFTHANFRDLASYALPGTAAGVLMDLGFSLVQLHDSERGFTFQQDGPLEMRLDQSTGRSLAQLLRRVPETTLGKVLRDYGEERRWKRIAAAIIQRRRDQRLITTSDLVAACLQGTGGKWQKIHPATRVFQALRIWVNDELSSLVAGLEAAASMLRADGRLVVISFHSLEDRIVKRYLRSQDGCVPPVRQLGKLLRPTAEETAVNKPSRSARLRVGVRH